MSTTTGTTPTATRRTSGGVCPEAFTEWGLRVFDAAPYHPFAARWVGDGRAELSAFADTTALTTKPFRARVKDEAAWTEQSNTRPVFASLPLADRKMIAQGLMECPCCDRGNMSPVFVGKNTSIEIATFRHCSCEMVKEFTRAWSKTPEHFVDCNLTTLAPSPKSNLPMDRQQKVIDFLRENPTDSYLFVGDGGVRKTHLSYALEWFALAKWAERVHTYGGLRVHTPPVLRASVPALMEQHHAWAMRSGENHTVPVPDITVDKIKGIIAEGSRPTVVLDEIDKVGNVTPAKLKVLFELVETCYAAKGQLIATSNVDAETLRQQWSKGQDEGASQMASVITRRCGDDEGARTITLRIVG